MNTAHFDDMTRSLTDAPSRRSLLGRFAGAALAAVAVQLPGAAEARSRKKKRRKRLSVNTFGCVDVGKTCRGNSGNCCSGICEGKKPKKGKKDKSRCVAHNVGSCTAEQDACLDATPASCGTGNYCVRTTGKASFCGVGGGHSAVCTEDADCDKLGYGPGAACAVCPFGTGSGTACFEPAA